MTRYIVRRLIQVIPLLAIISLIGFMIIQATGDPLAAYTVDASLTGDDIARLRAQYGLDKPVPIQYLNWVKNLFKGDWGYSYYTREAVRDMVINTIPNTLVLVLFSYVLTLTISVFIGIFTALKQYSVFDNLMTAISFIGISMPSFWMGLMLIVIFSVRFKNAGLPYLPVGGMFDFRAGPSFSQLIWHAILPTLTLSFVMIGKYIRYIRSSMLDQISQDYIRTARSKGLSEPNIMVGHAFKNVLLPVITIIGIDIPGLLSGTIVIESIFAWPGMGRLFWTSAQKTDIPVCMALLMFVAVLTVFSTIISDILYAVVDPRIKYQ